VGIVIDNVQSRDLRQPRGGEQGDSSYESKENIHVSDV